MMPFFACTFATSAVVLAVFFKTKDKKIKEMAIPNCISGIFGVTEPAISISENLFWEAWESLSFPI